MRFLPFTACGGWRPIGVVEFKPWRHIFSRKFAKLVSISQRVHRMPEPEMTESHQVPVPCHLRQRALFQRLSIIREVVQHVGFEDEEATVDPGFTVLDRVAEGIDAVAFDFDASDLCVRPNGGHRGELAMAPVEGQQRIDIHIAESIAIGDHESLAIEPFLQSLDATTGRLVRPCINDRDAPSAGRCRAQSHLTAVKRHGDVIGDEVVISEELLDEQRLIPGRHDEVLMAEMAIDIHDAGDDGATAYFDHRFGYPDRVVTNP